MRSVILSQRKERMEPSSFAGGGAVRCVLPVLWMTSCLFLRGGVPRDNLARHAGGLAGWLAACLTGGARRRTGSEICYLDCVNCYCCYNFPVFLYFGVVFNSSLLREK